MYGVQVYYEGKWCHAVCDSKILLYKTEDEAKEAAKKLIESELAYE